MVSFSLLLFCALENELKIWNEILFYIQKLNKRKIFGESFRNKVAIKIHLFKKKKKKNTKTIRFTVHFSRKFPNLSTFLLYLFLYGGGKSHRREKYFSSYRPMITVVY